MEISPALGRRRSFYQINLVTGKTWPTTAPSPRIRQGLTRSHLLSRATSILISISDEHVWKP